MSLSIDFSKALTAFPELDAASMVFVISSTILDIVAL